MNDINQDEDAVVKKFVSDGSEATKVDQSQTISLIRDHVKKEVKREIQREIKLDKATLFTVFGIFASIVTFISIDIQILKTFCAVWNVIGFSIIMLASLLSFILILDYIGRGWSNDLQFPWLLMGFIILLFGVGF